MIKNEFITMDYPYLEIIREWRNLPRIRNNMYSTNIISEEEQIVWFEGLKNDNTRAYFVFMQNKKPIGCLSFTDITAETCQWGCYIGAERFWPGSGMILEVAALDYAFKVLDVECLEAEVLEFNEQPQQMHKVFQYEFSHEIEKAAIRDGISYSAKVFKYTKEDWFNNREAIVNSLPGKFPEAMNQIYFNGQQLFEQSKR